MNGMENDFYHFSFNIKPIKFKSFQKILSKIIKISRGGEVFYNIYIFELNC
jgi:hypothetical protein